MNFRAVSAILGFLLMITGAMMLVPLPFSAWLDGRMRGGDAAPLLLSSAITMVVGALLWFSFRSERHGLRKREGFLVAASGWAVASTFGCLPYVISGAIPSFTDAYFETISGFTTTGATILSDIEVLPHGLLLWRAMTHWIGGMGILLLSIAILPMLGVGGMQLFSAEVSHVTVEKLTPRISQTARILWLLYCGLTAAHTLLLLAGGMSLFDALAHSFSTVSSGGFSTKNASLGHFDSAYIEWVTIIFMFLAGASFTLHFRALRGRSLKPYGRDNEFTYYSLAILVASALVYFGIPDSLHAEWSDRVRAALFQVVSLVSSTGFITSNYDLWAPATQLILLLLMFHAGCVGSTSGGLKVARWVLLLKSWKTEIKKLAHPRAIFVTRYNGEAVSPDIITSVQGFLIAYLVIFAISAVLLSAFGMDVLSATSAVISAMSNVGPGLGTVGAIENYGHVSSAAKWVLSFCMLMGRLEFFTVLVLFSPDLWKR
jgi:trk system potassium uptake protein TrkH